jgi:hypothetical protein
MKLRRSRSRRRRWIDDRVLDARAAVWVSRLMWRMWVAPAVRRR